MATPSLHPAALELRNVDPFQPSTEPTTTHPTSPASSPCPRLLLAAPPAAYCAGGKIKFDKSPSSGKLLSPQ
eukprot:CAMPEP_0198314242 /NCGR_PEP_ID=MMETSP1450-20131203/4963_1 /TAXON_ID=753684 ORGANISM="Madagascaria erythrocladiodes, Strain CCMP3234" /NCGR_SAMPLE_ID=MMETSP1450 /ASSEMBLY_ACC=CAM_ASM_001115 /LENGTH=71 /DNA_ID=CAMNT_0044017283 /DNA_START=324 /DNA_END=540 /DNA_ORIENTATION=-